jgi:hypothetical protein
MNERDRQAGWGARAQEDTQPGGIPGTGQRGGVRGPLLGEYQPPYRRRSGQVAAVLMYDNGGHSVLWPSGREDHKRPWLRQPYAVYEVALGRHVTRFDLQLPAAGDAEFFQAEAGVHWQVEDPVAVVHQQVRDVAELLRDELLDRLRYVSRQFRLTHAQRADEAVRAELNSEQLQLGADLGLRAKVHVRIDLSERVVERVREGTGLDHQLDLSEKEHALHRRKEQQQSELIREHARAFEDLLARGDASRIAYFMARDPENALQIEQHFARERRQDKADQLGFLTRLIDAGQIERHEIREGMYEALRYLQQSGRSIGRTVSEALPEGTQPREGPEAGSSARRRRPFWEDEEADGVPELEDAHADGEAGEPPVHEPTSVESSGERAKRTRKAEESAPRRNRASDQFDDWGDS